MPKKYDHPVHMYKRIVWGSKDKPAVIYKCILPDCHHYKHLAVAEGAVSLCNRCRVETVVLTSVLLSTGIVKPHCANCTRTAWNKKKVEGPSLKSVEDKLADILNLGDFKL